MKKFKILISRNFYKKQQNVMDLRKPSRIYYITFYLIAMDFTPKNVKMKSDIQSSDGI